MEFQLDHENVQIIIRDDINKYNSLNSINDESKCINSPNDNYNQIKNKSNLPQSQSDLFDLSNHNSYRCEILLKLQEYYLVNNIKLIGDIEDIQLNKLKFQNINNHLWESILFFNPDDQKVTIKENESLSIFCVGLTQFIKIDLLVNINPDLFSNRTLGMTDLDRSELIEIENFNMGKNNLTYHNQSMEDVYNKNNKNKNLKYVARNNNVICTKHIKSIIKKISVFSQHIYSIPNATFLLTLLNLKNFFFNNISHPQAQKNYLCATLLTATSMMQARLFIQAWELINKLQIHLINELDISNRNYFKILLGSNCLNDSIESTIQDNTNILPTFITKLEIIKSVCMYENGHTLAFLDSMRNCVQIYYQNDYSSIKSSIIWTKINEVCSDKLYIQNFLSNNDKIGEVILKFLNDHNEIITVSCLKIIEFIFDYHPVIVEPILSKIIKQMLKLINKNCLINKDMKSPTISDDLMYYTKKFDGIKAYYPIEVYKLFHNERNKKKESENKLNKNTPNINNNTIPSPILQKNINYAFDTFVNIIDNLSINSINKIVIKNSELLLELISKHWELDSITLINLIKLMRKIYENINTNIIDYLANQKSNNNNNCYNKYSILFIKLLSIGITTNKIDNFKEFIEINSQMSYNKNNNNKKFNSLGNNRKNIQVFNLIDNNELGNLINFIFDKCSEECFLFNDKEAYIELLDYIIQSINLLIKEIINSTQDKHSDFIIFHLYSLLYLLVHIYFNKNEIKSDINYYFINKIHPHTIKLLSTLINTLIELEELILRKKQFFCLFEILIEIFNLIKNSYNQIITINFSKIFLEQLNNLLIYISTSGVFNENIYYLIKIVPLIDTDNNEEIVKILSKIFKIILTNFSNYYNEDMFELFVLFLNKLKNNLNDDLINEIVKALINRNNYKGSSYRTCCSSFFESLRKNNDYYLSFVRNITQSFKIQSQNFEFNKGSLIKFKDFYIEFIEKLELYKNYIEHLKNSEKFNQFNQIDNILFSNDDISKFVFEIIKNNDIIILSKINEILVIDFELILSLIKNSNNNTNQDKDTIITNLTNLTKLLSKHLDFVMNYFLKANDINITILSDNFKALSKILSNFTIIHQLLKDKEIGLDTYYTNDNLYYINIYKSIYHSIPMIKLRNTYENKANTNELMNLIENLIIKYTEINTDLLLEEYYKILVPILIYYLDSTDDFHKIFGVEIILKFFCIKFEDDIGHITNNDKIKLNLPLIIWERILSLMNHSNYKIALFAVYLIQIVSPKDIINGLINIKSDNLSAKTKELHLSCLNEKYIILNNDNITFSQFFMNEKQIENLHNFIREKIIFDFKVKNTLERHNNEFPTLPSHIERENNDDKGLLNNNQIDEVNDCNIDFIKIPEYVDEKYYNNNENTGHNNINTYNNNDNIKLDENLSLEELGVIEVNEEIFDNFDEDNIPVIKNIYKRKKGSAEKLKTNQNARNLLMSNLVRNNNTSRENTTNNRFTDNNNNCKSNNLIENVPINEDILSDLQLKKSI